MSQKRDTRLRWVEQQCNKTWLTSVFGDFISCTENNTWQHKWIWMYIMLNEIWLIFFSEKNMESVKLNLMLKWLKMLLMKMIMIRAPKQMYEMTFWILRHLNLLIITCPLLWATSWANLFLPYANNKGTDQTVQMRKLISAFVAHPCSVISAFAVHFQNSIIHILAKFKLLRL